MFRCFTFGIGSGASSALVEGLAQAGNGTAEFVKEGERMQPKVSPHTICNRSSVKVNDDREIESQNIVLFISVSRSFYCGYKIHADMCKHLVNTIIMKNHIKSERQTPTDYKTSAIVNAWLFT